jgi:hypothetical protein
MVRPRSSVWISRAPGITSRIADIAATVASAWVTTARQNWPVSRAWGYQVPYRHEKRAVVSGSFSGVQSSTSG